jgi:NADP-dependent aldehyde dehydrogenase
VADCIAKAAKDNGIPAGVFHHLHGAGHAVGTALVQHPLTKAVGFTGSFGGGKALFDLANKRPEPIPVFAEMSSINPVILLPESLNRNFKQTAETLTGSITLSVGQFCTNPGLIIAVDNDGLKNFISALADGISHAVPEHMLNAGIAKNYYKKLENALAQKGVTVEAQVAGEAPNGRPVVASVQAEDFLKNPALAEEVFGPFSLIIKCKDIDQLHTVLFNLQGQLTATLTGEETELSKHQNVINILREKAGRIIINGVPTGVEVCPAMQHGGPFPSSTDSRFTAVGRDSIKRFVRPVCFQNFPDSLLPDELKTANPLGIMRLVNNELVRA